MQFMKAQAYAKTNKNRKTYFLQLFNFRFAWERPEGQINPRNKLSWSSRIQWNSPHSQNQNTCPQQDMK